LLSTILPSLLLTGVLGVPNDTYSSSMPKTPRTFLDCYDDMVSGLLAAPEYTPPDMDPKLPKVKTFISNYCNFFHEKTGYWIGTGIGPGLGKDSDKYLIKYAGEFIRRFNSTIPASTIGFWQNLNSTSN